MIFVFLFIVIRDIDDVVATTAQLREFVLFVRRKKNLRKIDYSLLFVYSEIRF